MVVLGEAVDTTSYTGPPHGDGHCLRCPSISATMSLSFRALVLVHSSDDQDHSPASPDHHHVPTFSRHRFLIAYMTETNRPEPHTTAKPRGPVMAAIKSPWQVKTPPSMLQTSLAEIGAGHTTA
jgi:hypothetical protein